MDPILEALKSLLGASFSQKKLAAVKTMLGLDDATLITSSEDLDDDSSVKQVTISEIAKELKALGYEVALPGLDPVAKARKGGATPPYETKPITPADEEPDDEGGDAGEKARKSMQIVHMARFSGEKEARQTILKDIFGTNEYVQTVYEQNLAFSKYLRGGEKVLTAVEMKLLQRQFFPENEVLKAVINGGLDVRTIKATQIESQGELGGIAVPPDRQAEISTRLPGLTAVRGSGANVVTLVNSNSIEIPQWRGATDRWMGMLRGQWGNETANAQTEQNFKLDLVPVVAYVYSYPVWMSRSLVEDAANLITILMQDIMSTLAIDEDDAFIQGDGVGKPYGILPQGANENSLRERVTGDSDELTPRGLKGLKRGVPSQYRRGAIWIGNSDTFGVIESMRDETGGPGTGPFLFNDLSENDMLLARRTFESEAMPDIAANAYPLIFGDMFGYTIVERLGMSIERYQDSYTGINRVKFETRRRIGGRIERPWLFALQKVATGDPFS